MLVLDENLPLDQQQRLRSWRLRFRLIGQDVAAAGTEDENLIVSLRRLHRPTFFSLEHHFYRRDWVHAAYCLAWLDVPRRDAGKFIRLFLNHRAFRTQAKRMGLVVRVHPDAVSYCAPKTISWPRR